MFSFLRASLPPKTFRADDNPIYYEDGASSLEFQAAGSEYLLRNQHPAWDPKKPSIMVPPFHWHIHQTEHFHVVSGTCHLFRDYATTPWITISTTDPALPTKAVIPKQVYHTINNASTTEPLVLDVNLTPEDYEGEQRFFRNFFGYLDDCRKAGVPPSPFQLFVFLHAADTPLGIPMPTRWMGLVAGRVVLWGMNFWGRYILGYQPSYPEYYNEKKAL